MNRRTLIKKLGVATAAAFALPSCLLDKKKVSVALSNLKITPEEEQLVSLLAETFIPETETPGARSLKADSFTLVMVNDCMDKADQEKYLAGLRAFEGRVNTLTGKSFTDASPEQRVGILNQVESAKDEIPDDVRHFYWTTRGYTIQGYTSSQHYLTNIKKYVHVPGPNFKGCVPVSNSKSTS